MTAGQVASFDSQRKGFTRGGSGALLLNYDLKDNALNSSERSTGFGMELKAGYCWNSHDVFAFDIFALQRKADNSDNTFVYTGIDWNHHFSQSMRSFYSLLGVGVSMGTIYHDAYLGAGFKIGGGYQFTDNFQIGLTYLNISGQSFLFKDHDAGVEVVYLTLSANLY